MEKPNKKRSKQLDVFSDDERDEEREEERRRKKHLRRAERLAKRFAALGLDEHGNALDNFSLLKYPVREWKFTIPGTQEPIALNPAVTLVGVVCLWGIVCWSSGKCQRSLIVFHAQSKLPM
jgi:hypothetical protein